MKIKMRARNFEFDLSLPATLEDMVAKYGELVVYKLARDRMIQAARCSANQMLNSKEPDVVRKAMETSWSPIQRARTLIKGEQT